MLGIRMSKNMKLVRIAAMVAVGALICATAFVIKATPPSGISFSPVGRATVPEFSVKRRDKALDWTVRLDADQPIDVATQIVTFQPGGFSGWHTHPGPVFFTVRTGTLTVYEGNVIRLARRMSLPREPGLLKPRRATTFTW